MAQKTPPAQLLDDHSGNGNHLTIIGGQYRLSDAPVGYETPQVRNALTGIETGLQETVDGSPAVQEYGDLQTDDAGELVGVMKRCYAYVKDGVWHLITGFKIGNIVTEWVGQAQYDPQVMGFVEGAPPVPSENLTAGPIDPGLFDYVDATALEVTESENVSFTYSSSRETGEQAAFGISAGLGIDFETGVEVVTAPLGVGVSIESSKLAEIEAEASVNASVEGAYGWSSASTFGISRNLTKSLTVSLGGNWEDPAKMLNQAPLMRRRFQPANVGFALVKSETADLFALRLAHNDALVGYRFRPNPDIPKDWNIIPFPINPRYTKQGSLDGRIGYGAGGRVCLDPDYPNAAGYGEYSYFKPREAYALKKRIERQVQEARVYFEELSVDPGSIGGSIARAVGTAMGAITDAVGGDIAAVLPSKSVLGASRDLPEKAARRSLVNTYVWTADGGFFAESTETAEVREETVGGEFSLGLSLGTARDLDIDFGSVAVSFGMEASAGGSMNASMTRARDAEKAFGIEMKVDPPGDLQAYDKNLKRIYDKSTGEAVIVPGKVDGYRFMTFYVEPSVENFDVFVNRVVDPRWLAESSHPNAGAIRQAVNAQMKAKKDSEKSVPYRVFHRVTFVSRILPPVDDQAASQAAKLMRAQNINSNWQLVKRLEPFVRDKTGDYLEFTDAVRKAVRRYMPALVPAEREIVQYMTQYFHPERH